MTLVKGSRENAVHSLINLWLKDKRKSCVYCSRTKFFEDCRDCGGIDPPLATNKEILAGFNQELEKIRDTRKNEYASNDKKDLRYAVSMPVGLYQFLSTAFKNMYGEDLFNDKYDINWFMKKFGKYFAIPEKI